MNVILWLFWLVYGGDVQRLDARDYGVRAQAYSRLKEAGAWAVPALKVGQANGSANRKHLIGILLDRRREWWWPLVQGAVHTPGLTADQLVLVGRWAVSDPEFGADLFRVVDATGAFNSSRSQHWCFMMPYACPEKTLAGEVTYMLTMTRNRLHAAPKQMPSSWFDWR